MNGFRAALGLLTRIPVPGRIDARDLGRSVAWFPVVGGLIGLGVAGAYVGFRAVVPAFVGATLAVGIGLALTGALHEDGLADTADAFGGGRNRDEIMGILKDPAHGTYGVLALLLSLLARIGALASLDVLEALAALPAAHALSRGAAGALLGAARPAAEEGLGVTYTEAVTRGSALTAVAGGLGLGLAAVGFWVLPAAGLCALAAVGVGRLSVRRIGGVTGDILGAVQQIGEAGVLLLAAGAGRSFGW